MKTAIVYYSMSGNTAYAAEKIAAALKADLVEIMPQQQYPDKGFKKFFWGGKSAMMAETPKLLPYDFAADAYDQIIFGFPVWAGNIPRRRLRLPERFRRGKGVSEAGGVPGRHDGLAPVGTDRPEKPPRRRQRREDRRVLRRDSVCQVTMPRR